MKQLFNRMKTSIWLYPALYSAGFLLLSVLISFIDTRHAGTMSRYVHDVLFTSAPLAQAILGIIASAFITIATFTFSTAMVVLTMYSSQFTPRVVENFLNNQTTMKSFGVFLSGFIYAITSLLLLKTDRQETLVLAAGVGVLYVIVGLVYFLVFVHSVSTYIQASGLIQRLQREAATCIASYHKFVAEAEPYPDSGLAALAVMKTATELTSLTDGYIQEIDYARMRRVAREHGVQILFRKVAGQFVTTRTRVMTVYRPVRDTANPPGELEESLARELAQCVMTGDKRTEAQDFGFTIQKIVEIAVKALSPGVNDPNTAIHCVNIIGLLMRELADLPGGYLALRGETEAGFAICEANRFDTLLYDAYHQIIHYGRADASVMIGVLKSLRVAREHATEENNGAIDRYVRSLRGQLEATGYDDIAYAKILHEMEAVA
jgi:uncharacterized membrane protein